MKVKSVSVHVGDPVTVAALVEFSKSATNSVDVSDDAMVQRAVADLVNAVDAAARTQVARWATEQE